MLGFLWSGLTYTNIVPGFRHGREEGIPRPENKREEARDACGKAIMRYPLWSNAIRDGVRMIAGDVAKSRPPTLSLIRHCNAGTLTCSKILP